jgi:serine/threonine-protein kinase
MCELGGVEILYFLREEVIMKDIPNFDTFTKVEPIAKGASDDKKYLVETTNGQKLLLRISDIENIGVKKAEYEMLKCVATLRIPISLPIDFGVCNDGKNVYQLLSWLEGDDLQSLLPSMTEAEHYAYGMKAGELLRLIHTIPAPSNAEPWEDWFMEYVQESIDCYNYEDVKFEEADVLIKYIQNNKHLLKGRPQTLIHSDFIDTNIIVLSDGSLGVIDFNYEILEKDYGDPWNDIIFLEEWDDEISPRYSTGFVRGYFGGEPPQGFFNMIAFYSACDVLAGLNEAYEDGEPEAGLEYMQHVLRWFGNMNNPVPTWYQKDFCSRK